MLILDGGNVGICIGTFCIFFFNVFFRTRKEKKSLDGQLVFNGCSTQKVSSPIPSEFVLTSEMPTSEMLHPTSYSITKHENEWVNQQGPTQTD